MRDLRKGFATGISLFLLLGLSSCAGKHMKPHYTKSSLQPVTVEKRSEGELVIRYLVPPESMYYASGINYEAAGDAVRVVMDRCAISDDCTTMIKRPTPLPEDRVAQVSLPYTGGKVTVVYTDGEEQVFP